MKTFSEATDNEIRNEAIATTAVTDINREIEGRIQISVRFDTRNGEILIFEFDDTADMSDFATSLPLHLNG